MKVEKLKKSKVAILWFGREGSSTLSFLRWIWSENITILDDNENIKKEPWINYVLWEKYLDNLGDFDLIIKTPWISPYNKKIAPHREKLTSQTDIFYSNYKGKTIWITATKWKSTTSTFLFEVLKNAWFKVKLVWNIWAPVLDEINFDDEYDFVVYELSSYMLEDLKKEDYISIIGNIYEDHLDWHQWELNYRNAKLNNLNKINKTIVNENIKIEWKNLIKFGKNSDFSYKNWSFFDWNEEVFTNKGFTLIWEHNMMNILSILALCKEIWVPFDNIVTVGKMFKSLPHRMEKLWTFWGVSFVDDAISTTPESTIEAIKTFWSKIWVIFLGWLDRWYKFDFLVEKLKEYWIKNVVLFPETWKRIKKLLDGSFNICETMDMKIWVDFAFKNTQKGEIVLLSTASPSYNLWKNYEAKWDDFQNTVKNYQIKK